MLWHICHNYRLRPPLQPPVRYWNVRPFKYNHHTCDSNLLISKGLLLPSTLCAPSLSCLSVYLLSICLKCSFAWIAEGNSGGGNVCIFTICSNNTTHFPSLLGDVGPTILMNLAQNMCTPYFCTPVCGYIYFWMDLPACRVSACTRENNIAQFPFLWTSLCQGDWWREICWINVILPQACQGACPLL